MLGLMKKQLESKNIPYGYPLCFNDECAKKEKCMHYQARLLKLEERLQGPAVYPIAWRKGECKCYNEKGMVTKAWGFTHIYDNVPHYLRAEARRRVRNYFSRGCGPYYRYHHGENKLLPKEQADILAILVQFAPTDGICFDHYETDWDFG